MSAHTESEFNDFMSQLRKTNQTLSYFFVDFDKVTNNVNKVRINLNLLNSLVNCIDIKNTINDIFEEYGAKPFEALEILIAVRDSRKGIWVVDKSPMDEPKDLATMFKTPEGIYNFLEATQLLRLFQGKEITNLVDYVFGIEVGMDTNARKNRSGKIMENEVAERFRAAGVPFKEQVKSQAFDDLKPILGKDVKKFDFVIETKKKKYVLEVNFYNGGGSKPNETARAYTGIAPKINKVGNYEFVWITDGDGWNSAKPEIKQAYETIPSVYNLTNIDVFIKKIKAEGFFTDTLF
ncbi:MAG: type II restriction endonuclease [Bacteroidaceae bacterium]|nr:type II restriction endonuclease [Bacteroidaceae bacterium]